MFCIFAAIFMTPLLPRDLAEPEPEADSEAAEQTVEPLRAFNKKAIYCVLNVCRMTRNMIVTRTKQKR